MFANYRDIGLGQWHRATVDCVRKDGRIDLTSDGLPLTRIEVWAGPRDQTPRGMAWRSAEDHGPDGDHPEEQR